MARALITLNDSEAHVWLIDVESVVIDNLDQTLDIAELEQAGKFRFPEHARRYKVARHLLRAVLARYLGCEPGEIVFEQGTNGKPGLMRPRHSGLKFNTSHSGRLVAIAVARSEVGVDVEEVKVEVSAGAIAGAFFSPGENTRLKTLDGDEKVKAFFQLWTRKEALLKATGEGLGSLTKDVDVSVDSVFARAGKMWSVVEVDSGDQYAGALAIEGEVVEVKYINWGEICP